MADMFSQRPNLKVSGKIRRHFPEGTVFRDATVDLRLVVSIEDLMVGIPNDPAMCALAHCVNKFLGLQPGEPGCAFFQRYAWIPYPDADGRMTIVERYTIPKEVRRYIARFDAAKTQMVQEGRRISLVLRVPSPAESLPAQRIKSRKWHAGIKKDPARLAKRKVMMAAASKRHHERKKHGSVRRTLGGAIVHLPFSDHVWTRNLNPQTVKAGGAE